MLTKVATVALGVVQTAIVLRLLGPERYGIVNVAISLGALVGVSQHAGVADAAIREIAVADHAAQRAAVFWSSLWFRLAVTVPLSLLFAASAPFISRVFYPLPDFTRLLWLTAILLVLHGVQGVLGGAYSGQRAFGRLYLLQLIMAVLNVPLFAALVWVHGARGFFEAAIIAASGFSLLLALFLRPALGNVAHPNLAEMRRAFRGIVATGMGTYVARILSVAWQRIPILVLGRWASPEIVGLFTAATTFGTKLQLLAAAIGEVNLAFLSRAFAESRETFRRLAERTLRDVGVVTLLAGLGLILFADILVPLLAGREYLGAIPLVAAVTWGFAAYAVLDIATNTVFVPARQAGNRAVSFGVLVLVTITVLFLLRTAPLQGALVAVLTGGIAGLLASMVLAGTSFRLALVPPPLAVPLLVAVVLTVVPLPLAVRFVLYAVMVPWVGSLALPNLRRRFTQVAARIT